MNDLEMYREQLAICDDKIIDALMERNAVIEKIMAYKETYGMPVLAGTGRKAGEAKKRKACRKQISGRDTGCL